MPRRGPLRTTACGFRRTGLKQALPARSARSSSVPQGRPLVRSPPRRRLTCPRVLTLTDVDFGAHLTTSAPFRVRARARIRPVIRDGGGGTSHGCPGFPLPFGHRHSLPGHPVPAGDLGLPCGRLTGHRLAPGPGRVGSGQGAVPVFQPVRLSDPPSAPGVPITEHRALRKPRQVSRRSSYRARPRPGDLLSPVAVAFGVHRRRVE